MKKLALIYALLLAASPAAAQLATSSRVQELNGQSVQTTPIEAPTTGVFCIEEMTATFCNESQGRTRVATARAACPHLAVGPHQAAYLHRAAGASAISPSIPPCSSEPPFNELCN